MLAEKIAEVSATENLEVTIDRAVLLRSLGHVQSVVERRGTVPILSNIRFEAQGDTVEMTATDMDIAVVEQISAQVARAGTVTIPAHTFYEIVRKLPEGAEIRIRQKESKVTISAGSPRFSLATLPVEDFPAIAEGELAHSFVLSGRECKALIEKTRFAMSTEETRYYLNGVYLHQVEQDGQSVLRAVATDGHRLARVEVPCPAGASEMPGVIIPRKTIGELAKLIEQEVDEVKFSLSETKLRVVCGKAVLVSKLIDGNFPDYERVIPQKNENLLEVPTAAFARAVDRVSVISAEKTRGIKLAVDAGKLVLSASSPEQGTAQEELEASYAADPIEIGFNSRYLLEVLTQIEGDTVQVLLHDSAAPAVIRDASVSGVLYVIMPMRV